MKFEYKVEGGVSEARMNELGAQGWDLVSVQSDRYTFKRSKPREETPARELFDTKSHGAYTPSRSLDGPPPTGGSGIEPRRPRR